jgi:hypothetical protein
MSFEFNVNFFKDSYFGDLKPNIEENIMFYEEQLKIDDDAIVYKYNNKGFRCDDFTKDVNGIHMLFGGCSETEGAANLLEDTWAKVLYNKIKESNDVAGYYNVGKAGLTTSTVVMNVFQYIYEYGCPDYIFLYLPDQIRHITWSGDRGFYPTYESRDIDIGEIEWKSFFNQTRVPEVINVNILYTSFLFKILVQFCEMNGIKLFWSTWHTQSADPEIVGKDLFKGYIPTFPPTKEYWEMKIEDMRARDGYHYGRGYHKIWAEKFYKGFLDDKNNKKNNS